MTARTRTMVAESQQVVLDTTDGRQDAKTETTRDYYLLDDVFQDMLTHNIHRSGKLSLDTLLEVTRGHPGLQFLYLSKGVPYRGAAWLVDGVCTHPSRCTRSVKCLQFVLTACSVTEYDGGWINIKVHNDGFEYAFRSGKQFRRHQGIPSNATRLSHKSLRLDAIDRFYCAGWVKIDWQDLIPQFPTIYKATVQKWDSVIAWYNYKFQRLELKMWPSKESKLPRLLISFEGGWPEEDYRVLAEPLRSRSSASWRNRGMNNS